MTKNDNIYHNVLEYFTKKHLSFTEHSLKNTNLVDDITLVLYFKPITLFLIIKLSLFTLIYVCIEIERVKYSTNSNSIFVMILIYNKRSTKGL